MSRKNRLVIIAILACLCLSSAARMTPASAQTPDANQYQWVKVVGGFDYPILATNAHDGSGRLFVVELGGTVFIIDKNGKQLDTPFLDITDIVIDDVVKGGYTERGLLGLAFHPNYAQNGIFFVDYINRAGDTVLARYKVSATDPNQADPTSATILFTVKQPYNNHKGGMLAFGLDGYLYVSLGDGGNLGDPDKYAQNKISLLGKILRLDINNDSYKVPDSNPFVKDSAYRPEIWAMGFRNPWRFSFDTATGDLYIGDVGEANWEEIDYQPTGDKGGENYGWNLYEGDTVFTQGASPTGLTMPIQVYDHGQGCAIIGGYVYRGKALPALDGLYFYGDYCSEQIWTLHRDANNVWQNSAFMKTKFQITAFGEDEAGELYLLDLQGDLYKLAASSTN